MNWESWLEPKNSLMAATTGRALINDAEVTVVGSLMVMRSLMIRSMRIRPIRNWVLQQLAHRAHAAVCPGGRCRRRPAGRALRC